MLSLNEHTFFVTSLVAFSTGYKGREKVTLRGEISDGHCDPEVGLEISGMKREGEVDRL